MAVEIVVPQLSESVLEARVARWLKREGEAVAAGETVAELETDKVNLEVGAQEGGVLAEILRSEGESVRPGDVLARLSTAGEVTDRSKADEPAQKAAPPARDEKVAAAAIPNRRNSTEPGAEAVEPAGAEGLASDAQKKATPVAQRIAAQHDVDLAEVPGTGPLGRVTKHDMEAYLEQREAARAPAGPSATRRAAGDERREERVPMSLRRKTIARRLVEAQRTAAMLTTFNEVDMRAVMDARARHGERFRERHGVGLGIVSFFVKAAVAALQAFPLLNAEIQGDEIVKKSYFDIGVAIGAEEGLVVPVLRDADRLSFGEIESAIKAFAAKAVEGRLSIDDLRGGTFTITNGGVFGSLLSTPILNPPQAGILGLHRIDDRPVVRGGQIVVRPMMNVALTYDHRIVDGREAVQFLVRVKELVEDPAVLLLESR